MQTNPMQHNPLSRSLFLPILMIIALLILLGGVGILGYKFFVSSHQVQNNQQTTNTETKDTNVTDTFGAPGGELLLSAVTTAATSTGAATDQSGGIVSMILSAADNTVVAPPVGELSAGNASVFQYNVSPNGSYVTFLGMLQNEDIAVSSVYRTDDLSDQRSVDDIIGVLQKAKPVVAPTNTDYFREAPVVSNSGVVAYSSLNKDTFTATNNVGTLPAENWNVYVTDAQGKSRKLSTGLSPKWIAENRLVYLRNDGVYLYNLDNDTKTKVWDLNYVPTLATGFDVSDDGVFMALSNLQTGTVTIVRANAWDTASLSLYATISSFATYPVFSPDDAYLAMFTLQTNSTDAATPTLRYYSLEQKGFIQQTFSIDTENLVGLYLTDWLY